MSTTTRAVIIITVVALAALAFVARQKNKSAQAGQAPGVALGSALSGSNVEVAPAQASKLPRLVDLGAGKCIPCKMMAPILEELRTEYAGRVDVVLIDVWESPDAGKVYDIDGIPTQNFYDAEGRELFRHRGFFGKNDILAKWTQFGFLREPNPKSTRPQ